MPLNENSPNDSTVDPVIRDIRTVVITNKKKNTRGVFKKCGTPIRLYIKEDADINDELPGHVRLDCVKVPQDLGYDPLRPKDGSEWCGGRWNFVSNGFFSGLEVGDSAYSCNVHSDRGV